MNNPYTTIRHHDCNAPIYNGIGVFFMAQLMLVDSGDQIGISIVDISHLVAMGYPILIHSHI